MSVVQAQPVNDNPCSATYLPFNTYLPSFNNGGTYGPTEPAVPPCFDAAPYNTVWFYFTAPANGCVTIKTKTGTNADTQIGLYGGACGSLSLIPGTNCNDNVSSCSGYNYRFSYLQVSGLTAGQDYYIMVDGRTIITGSFLILIENVCPGSTLSPVPGQDCGDPFPVCDYTISVPNPGYSDYGNVCDFDWTAGCLLQGEKETVWYAISINGTGNLEFDIIPNDWTSGCTGGSETDYDFALWKVAGSGATSVCGNLGAPVRCNYSSLGVTGISVGGLGPASLGGSCWDVSYDAEMPVLNGERYLLVISNWDNTNSGFTLQIKPTSPILSTIPAGGTLVWTGALNTSWFQPENWGGCQIPNCNYNTVIPNSATNMPIISLANASTRNIVVNAGGTLTINANQNLMVCGNFLNYGTFNAGTGSTVIFEDTAVTAPLSKLHNQTMEGVLTTPNDFWNVTIKKPNAYKVTTLNDVTMSGDFFVTGGAYGGAFDATNMRHLVGGNFTVDVAGTYIADYIPGSTLEFIGTAQTYFNRGNVNSVVMNQTGAGTLTLLDPGGGVDWMVLSDSGKLTLNYGKILTSTNKVVVKNRSFNAISMGNATSYVQGTSGLMNASIQKYLNQTGIDTGTYHFPVGTPGKGFQRLSLKFTSPLPSGVNYVFANFNDNVAANNTSLGAECGISYHVFPATPLNNGYWQLQLNPASQFSSGVFTPYLYNTNYSNSLGGWTVMYNKSNPATAASWLLDPAPGVPTCANIISPVTAVRRVGASASTTLLNAPTVYFATAQSFLPLPVDLLHFDAQPREDHIALNWVTSSEENNLGFEVQRTGSLSSEFETIAFVKGHGTTSEQHIYSYADYEVEFNHEYFYRLKQVDFNGAVNNSQVISARLDKHAFSLFAYYDAGTSSTNLVYHLNEPSDVRIDLFNAVGQAVKTIDAGRQEAGNHQVTLAGDVTSGAAGIYMVRMVINDEVHFERTFIPGH